MLGHPQRRRSLSIQHGQLGQQDGGPGVRCRLHADAGCGGSGGPPRGGDLAHDGGQLVAAGKDGAAVAIAAQRWLGKKLVAGDVC